jgi:hypothetical protein
MIGWLVLQPAVTRCFPDRFWTEPPFVCFCQPNSETGVKYHNIYPDLLWNAWQSGRLKFAGDCFKMMKRPQVLMILCCCLVAILPRLFSTPLPWNFSPLAALALLCGATLQRPWLAILIPLACRIATDLLIETRTGYGFYPSVAFDYAAYALISSLGRFVQPKQWFSVLSGGVTAAVLFFLVSNFGVWCVTGEQVLHGYSNDLSGLLLCYQKGIPFAQGTFIGDILFSGAFFSIWNLLSVPAAVPEASASETA